MKPEKNKWYKGLFMKAIVIFCIAYAVRVVERGLDICENQAISPATIVTAAITFFGAELGLCVLKRIFSKDGSTTRKEKKAEKGRAINNDFQIPIDEEMN